MRELGLGLVGATLLMTGCNYEDTGNSNAASSAVPTADSPGPSSGQPSTEQPGPNGPSSTPPSSNCSDAAACGGDAVGTWVVSASCLEISGDLDVFLTSLGCGTVPATGSLQTSGTLLLDANGTYTDNTTTTGSVSFPLGSSCLAISGVDVECTRVGDIFASVGWKTSSCSETDGMCHCELSTEQKGGLGVILPYTEPSGAYTTSGTTLTASNASYEYCAAADTLTLYPQMAALQGNVTLTREGATPAVMPSMSSTAGTPTTPDSTPTVVTEPNPSQNAGGMMSMVGQGGGPAGGAGGGMGGTGPGAGGNGGSGGNEPSVSTVGPCDIYNQEGTPCVAAHSTVRALFGGYDGNLYQVRRQDGMTQDIPVLAPGGFADSAVQDAFCSGGTCTIWRVYDQTGNDNFIEAQTPDSSVGGHSGMTAANAAAESVTVGGNKVYSLFTRPSQAYWNDGSQTGMPLGAEPQGIYMVTSGEHFNGGCCYNYGNGQLDRTYHGGPTMDALYFGNNTIWGTGAGDGPWVMADMEDGMLAWGNGGNNPNSMSLPHTFVTAMEKNNGTSQFALKGGDATRETLNTMWNGALPGSKNPMRKEGGVLLGAGGDCCYSNNNASEGTFYEGAIVAGYPSDETDEKIHMNIVEVGYGK